MHNFFLKFKQRKLYNWHAFKTLELDYIPQTSLLLRLVSYRFPYCFSVLRNLRRCRLDLGTVLHSKDVPEVRNTVERNKIWKLIILTNSDALLCWTVVDYPQCIRDAAYPLHSKPYFGTSCRIVICTTFISFHMPQPHILLPIKRML